MADRRAWYAKYIASRSPERLEEIRALKRRSKLKYRANLSRETKIARRRAYEAKWTQERKDAERARGIRYHAKKREQETEEQKALRREHANTLEKKRLASRNPEERELDRKKDNARKVGKQRNLYLYGITQGDYARLLATQNGGCAICGSTNQNGHRLGVDHCHKTHRMRGLLCHNCNLGLGKFQDDPKLLRLAIAYIERWA